MKIQTNEEPLRWRKKNYHIDIENELAFSPHQIRDAFLCYHKLARRGRIRPDTMVANRRSFLARIFSGSMKNAM